MKNAFFTLAMALGMAVTAYLGGIGIRAVVDSGYYDMRLLAVDIFIAVAFWMALMIDEWLATPEAPVIGVDMASGYDRTVVTITPLLATEYIDGKPDPRYQINHHESGGFDYYWVGQMPPELREILEAHKRAKP